MKKKKGFLFILALLLIFYLFSCAGTVKYGNELHYEQFPVLNDPEPSQAEPEPPLTLTLTFAGDIMAHTSNFRMKDYSLIYKDIESVIKNDDFSFANLETPVHQERPYENYPNFNVQAAYPDAAIAAGFDVFSLANNHTNDQENEGIIQTYKYFKAKVESGVYAAGIKENPENGISYQLIQKNGWTILYAAVTEILNRYTFSELIDYIEPTSTRREKFKTELQTLRNENPCDLFILSIHTCEDEYVPAITSVRRNYYYSLIDSGVDIVWANHPHIAKEWEIVTRNHQSVAEQETWPSALIMYALGNTISGQRYAPDFANPANSRDNTGDGYLIQVSFEKDREVVKTNQEKSGFRITDIKPYLITTYIDPAWNYVIKQLDDKFISTLTAQGRTAYAAYFTERKKIMENIKGKHIQR